MSTERQYVIQGTCDLESNRLDYAIQYMKHNKAYLYAVERSGGDSDGNLLNSFIECFTAYRTGWRNNPQYAVENSLGQRFYQETGYIPLCIDIETSSICDLACPFCYRQSIITPDMLIKEALFFSVIEECEKIGVSSVKLNWRGEPLLHPKLPNFIDYAKKHGILETIINTNAVTLTEAKSRALINSGLDLMIYSFDGGTKETYEKMRPGRFQDNLFEKVYGNIRRFAQIRQEMGTPFPRTKIQMVLTEETFNEQASFFNMFSDCVDDVSVKAYTERGGDLSDLDATDRSVVADYLNERHLPIDTPYWKDIDGNIFVCVGRLPCEQIYQRLVVAYDGSVSMCCYDWGGEYPVGYVDFRSIDEGNQAYETVVKKIRAKARGFKSMSKARMPEEFIDIPKKVQSLKEIWDGRILNNVRQSHVCGMIESIPICKHCQFKETYKWQKVNFQK